MLRAVKNQNGVIICFGNDEGQSGQYLMEGAPPGEWCAWTFESFPALSAIEGAEERAYRYKENAAGDGIEARPDADVLASPQG